MTSQTLGFSFYHLLKQCLAKGKGEDMGNTKIWISWEQKTAFK